MLQRYKSIMMEGDDWKEEWFEWSMLSHMKQYARHLYETFNRVQQSAQDWDPVFQNCAISL